MIKANSNAVRYLVGKSGTIPYLSTNTSGAGMIRFANGKLEAYDGYNWLDITPSLELEMSSEMLAILDWANVKMKEDQRIKKLLDTHPGLREAHDKFEIMKTLVLKEQA